jgi:hypothetical protein
MGRWSNGRCQEVGGKKLEEYCKEQGRLAEASEEGLGSKRAVVPMMIMMMILSLLPRLWIRSTDQFQFRIA